MFKAAQQQHSHSTTFQHSPSSVGTVHETTVMIWSEARALSACPRECGLKHSPGRNPEYRVESESKSELKIPKVWVAGREPGIDHNFFEETDGWGGRQGTEPKTGRFRIMNHDSNKPKATWLKLGSTRWIIRLVHRQKVNSNLELWNFSHNGWLRPFSKSDSALRPIACHGDQRLNIESDWSGNINSGFPCP